MSEATRLAYFSFAKQFYPKKNMFEIITSIENIRNDSKLQDHMFLNFLIGFGKDDYFLKTELADICGTYTLGNYVANYVKKKYSNDKRYLLQISQRKKEVPNNSPNDQVLPDEKIEEIREDQDISAQTFKKVEIEAQFPGGEDAFRNYLRNELSKISNPPDLKLIVSFKILQDGLVDSVSIENPTNTEIEQKVISIIKNSPKWIPAQVKDSIKVAAYRRQPITLGNPDGQ